MAANDEIVDGYGFARALLSEPRLDGHESGNETIARVVKRFGCSAQESVWGELVAEADHHGVVPLLQPIITAPENANLVPDQVRRSFLALASRHRRAALAREACIDRLLEAFALADVPIILLKGAALAHRIYRHPELRSMADVDVLIDPADTGQAVTIAKGLGYSFASQQGSRFSGRMHHLPVATMHRSGFPIALEIHHDAMSSNQLCNLNFHTLTAKPESFRRGAGPNGLTLGHIDMLRHLAHHAFEPAWRVRLIHLYDLWRYQTVFNAQIDWYTLQTRFPEVITVLRLVANVFAPAGPGGSSSDGKPAPAGVGLGMPPLSEVAAADMSWAAKLNSVFNPPAWWLHGFYGIPPDRSLATCRAIRHPANVVRWLSKRLAAGLTAPNRISTTRSVRSVSRQLTHKTSVARQNSAAAARPGYELPRP